MNFPYHSLSDLPYLEAQAQFVGEYGSNYYGARYNNKEFDKTYLKQMANIMSNSGYGDTEAVKWIENLK